MSGMSPHSYERLLSRNRELEVDLASAVTGLERAQADSLALQGVHQDLVATYRRLCDQHEALQVKLKDEQEEKRQMAAEHQEQLGIWRKQLEAKAREFEAMQGQIAPPRELDAIRLQLIEEIEVPAQQRLQALEGRLAVEQRKAADARRQTEVFRIEATQCEQELKDAVVEAEQQHRIQEGALKRKITDLETELRHQEDVAGSAMRLRAQLQDQGARLIALQDALAEAEKDHEETQRQFAEQVKSRAAEVSSAKRAAHECTLQLEQEKRKLEQSVAECEALRLDVRRLTAQVAETQAQVATAYREEEQRVRREFDQDQQEARREQERLQRALQDKEADCQKLAFDLKRLEARLEQQRETYTQQELEVDRERQEIESKLQRELEKLKAEKDLEGLRAKLERRKPQAAKAQNFIYRLQDAQANIKAVMRENADLKSIVNQRQTQQCERDREDAEADLKKAMEKYKESGALTSKALGPRAGILKRSKTADLMQGSPSKVARCGNMQP